MLSIFVQLIDELAQLGLRIIVGIQSEIFILGKRTKGEGLFEETHRTVLTYAIHVVNVVPYRIKRNLIASPSQSPLIINK